MPCCGLVGLLRPMSLYLARALCATASPKTDALHLHAFALVTASPPPLSSHAGRSGIRRAGAGKAAPGELGQEFVCLGEDVGIAPPLVQRYLINHDTTNLPSSSSAESSADWQKGHTPRCYLLSAVDLIVDGIARHLLPCCSMGFVFAWIFRLCPKCLFRALACRRCTRPCCRRECEIRCFYYVLPFFWSNGGLGTRF